MKGINYPYRPEVGEEVWISPPGSDDENGYVFQLYEILWFDATFVLYRKNDSWPNLDKWIHIAIEPLKPEGE